MFSWSFKFVVLSIFGIFLAGQAMPVVEGGTVETDKVGVEPRICGAGEGWINSCV